MRKVSKILNDDDDRLYGRMAAAQFLGCAECTVTRWADQGHIPFSRDTGNKRLFRFADLRKFKRANPRLTSFRFIPRAGEHRTVQ